VYITRAGSLSIAWTPVGNYLWLLCCTAPVHTSPARTLAHRDDVPRTSDSLERPPVKSPIQSSFSEGRPHIVSVWSFGES